MSERPYEKQVTYHFKPGQEDGGWLITDFCADRINFEEVSKNGQEDTHMYGEAWLVDGSWALEADTRDAIVTYSGAAEADAIVAYFNKHGVPVE